MRRIATQHAAKGYKSVRTVVFVFVRVPVTFYTKRNFKSAGNGYHFYIFNAFSFKDGMTALFKLINDSRGHAGGDAVLGSVARLLSTCVRSCDVVARWGGEEFVVALPSTPLEGACEGVMACSTCHVIVDSADFETLPAASEEEEDLLDLAAHATRTSRLACQIILTEDMQSLTVRIPAGATNWMGR